MKRRSLLLGLGAVTSLGIPRFGSRRSRDHLAIRIWLTDSAAEHGGVAERAAGYVGRAFETAGVETEISFGDSALSFSAENDRHVRRVAWPRAVLEGVVGLGPVDPVADVNLLLTDGDATGKTAGYAMSNIAAVAGARRLAEMPPVDETEAVVEYSVPAAITQLLLHECGHAVGLGHEDGTVSIDAGRATVSPMISGYAWASESVKRKHLPDESNGCGDPLLEVTNERRDLSLRYSQCAVTAIREYRGGVLP